MPRYLGQANVPMSLNTPSPLLAAVGAHLTSDGEHLAPWSATIESVTISDTDPHHGASGSSGATGSVVYTHDGRCVGTRGGSWRQSLVLRVELQQAVPTAASPGGLASKGQLDSDGNTTSKPLLAIQSHGVFNGLWRIVTVDSTRRVITCAIPKYSGEKFQPGPFAVTVPSAPGRNVIVTSLDLTSFDGLGDAPKATAAIAPPLYFHSRLSVFSLDEIDTVARTFRANTYLELRARAISEVANEEMAQWLFNSYGFSARLVKFLNVIEKDGEVERWAKFSQNTTTTVPGTELMDYSVMQSCNQVYGEDFDLRRFPFDAMELRITATINVNSTRAMAILNREYPSVLSVPSFRHKDIFELPLGPQVLAREQYSDPSESSAGYIYSHVEFKVILARKGAFYIWNVAMPIAVITFLAALSIGSVEPNGDRLGTSDRFQVTLALLLTSVAYKFVVSGSLPQVSYLTDLDHYVHLCNGWIVAAMVENALFTAFGFDRYGSKPKEYFDETYIFALYVGSFVAANVYFWYQATANIRKRDTEMQRLYAEENELRRSAVTKNFKYLKNGA